MAKQEVIEPGTVMAMPAAALPVAADPMMAMIERVVLDPNADISKLERLLDMKERLEDRARDDAAAAAKRAFFAGLAAAQAEVPLVVRTRKNAFAGYTYADLADIETQAMPIIRKHGFAVVARSESGADAGFQRVRMQVSHIGGHVEDFADDFPLDVGGKDGKSNKTGVQAKGSTTSYGRRYMLCGFFGIATADDDGQGGRRDPRQGNAAPQPTALSGHQVNTLRSLIASTGTDESKFLAAAKVEAIEDIPPAEYNRLLGLLKRKQTEQAAAKKAEATATAEPAKA
jgi:hypothetical protein